jgi:hypothetical protein
MTGVVTKVTAGETFGNDGDVVTKVSVGATFGNYRLGFIRTRKRQLKGGAAEWREYRARKGIIVTSSTSFDLVRAIRIDGKPRHQFVLGLGSLKDKMEDHALSWFWLRALWRMKRHGLDPEQRHALAKEMIRKGATLPTADKWRDSFGEERKPFAHGRVKEEFPEILGWIMGHAA